MNAPLLSGVFFLEENACGPVALRQSAAPRCYALLSCSLVLVIAGVSAYGMTVPSMMQAHAAREPRVGHEVKSDLGTTTGYP